MHTSSPWYACYLLFEWRFENPFIRWSHTFTPSAWNATKVARYIYCSKRFFYKKTFYVVVLQRTAKKCTIVLLIKPFLWRRSHGRRGFFKLTLTEAVLWLNSLPRYLTVFYFPPSVCPIHWLRPRVLLTDSGQPMTSSTYDWFFLGQDFTIRTVSVVQAVYFFCFQKLANLFAV